ncbi:MAG: AAA family ATPase [bacterium]|nr:AAA family ATPase [bacterium]
MFLSHYGLDIDPFPLRPSLDFLFMSKAHEEAIAHLVYGVEHEEDVILITGDIGTGKTLALHRLLDFSASGLTPVMINVTILGLSDLMRLMLLQLEVEVDSLAPDSTLVHALEKRLIEERSRGRRVLLIIDEAQNLDEGTLEGVRLLLNLAQPGGQAMQLVLVGQLPLATKLALSGLRQLKQRIRVHYQLDRLDRREVEEYIQHRLTVAGRADSPFVSGAYDEIYRLSGGVPRVVNQIANKALLAGFVAGAYKITKEHIGQADAEPAVETTQGSVTVGAPMETGKPRPRADATTAPILPEPPQRRLPDPPPHRAAVDTAEPVRSRSIPWRLIVVIVLVVAVLGTFPWWGSFVGLANPRQAPDESSLSPSSSEVRPVVKPHESVPDVDSSGDEKAPAADSISTVAVPISAPARDVEHAAGGYAVHVASFSTADVAATYARTLGGQGLLAFVTRREETPGRIWHRVYIGPQQSWEEAEIKAGEIMEAGLVRYVSVHRLR